jgi:hypothetical protein
MKAIGFTGLLFVVCLLGGGIGYFTGYSTGYSDGSNRFNFKRVIELERELKRLTANSTPLSE